MSTAAFLQSTATKPQSTSLLPSAGPLLQRKCACGLSASSSLMDEYRGCKKKRLQTKISIDTSNDPLEQEADRVADKVLAGPTPPAVRSAALRMQRFTGQTTENAAMAPTSVDRVLKGPGRQLDPALRQDMEGRFGHDFSQVRVHTGSDAEQSAQDVNAHAYTVGKHIVFGAGRFSPDSHKGRRLLVHELAHVVQQSGSCCYLARQPANRSLGDIAEDFKKEVNVEPGLYSGRPNITETGQNFWTVQIWDRINQLVDNNIQPPLRADFKALTNAITQGRSTETARLKTKIKGNATYERDHSAKKLLTTNAQVTGRELYNKWWQFYMRSKTLPNLNRYLTIPILEKIAPWEFIACGYTAANVAAVRKLHGSIGKGKRNPKNAFSANLMATSRAKRDTCRASPHSNRAIGDVVNYIPLPPIVNKIKNALADGFVIYTRVLSGYGVGSNTPMMNCRSPEQGKTQVTIKQGEHYILVIGHDQNNRFLFWDPHSSDSKKFGGGFGYLFLDASNKRLTTAENNTELAVDQEGNQANGQHRYQPLYVSTK